MKYKISQNLSKAEALKNEVDKLANDMDPKKIKQKMEAESKIESLFDEIKRDLNTMKIDLKSKKKSKNYSKDFEEKEKMYKLLDERFRLIKDAENGVAVKEEIKNNKQQIAHLEEVLKERQDVPEREIDEGEKEKIQEWKSRVKQQDAYLDAIEEDVIAIGREDKKAEGTIDDIGRNVQKVSKHVDKTTSEVKSKNEQLKDVLDKIRSGDKCCVTLIMILILFGLIVVLYSIIKKKWF